VVVCPHGYIPASSTCSIYVYLSKSFRVVCSINSCGGHGSRVCVPFDKVVDDCDLTSWLRENEMRKFTRVRAPRSSS
jgi:hypothetical protein